MEALGLVVSDKRIFENCILKTYFLTPWPTYATNWNGLNNVDRGPPRHHSCEVWSKSKKRFQMRCSLKKLLTHARTDARTDDGQRTPDIEGSQKLTKHFVLRWAKKSNSLWTTLKNLTLKHQDLHSSQSSRIKRLAALDHKRNEENDQKKKQALREEKEIKSFIPYQTL